jgi:S-adenosylmethionine synthetase
MGLEAAAGKNPVSHVGKIYSVVARQIAESVVAEIRGIAHARCLIVSRIGAPVTSPALMAVNIASHERRSVTELHKHIEAIAVDRLARIPALVDDFVNGTIELF